MKRILLLLFSLITTAAIGQYPINQILSSDSTMVSVGRNATGGIRGGLVNMVFADTTAANLSRISYYTGAQIWTTTDSAIWVRFKGTPSFWVKMAGASGGTTGSFWNITGNYFGGGVPLNYGVGTNSYDYLPLKTNNITRLLIPPDGILRSSAPANKYLMMDTTTLEMYYGGEVATPTWQQTLTAGSTLTQDNTITSTGYDFSFNGQNIQFNATDGVDLTGTIAGTTSTISVDGSQLTLRNSRSGATSGLDIRADSIMIEPHLGLLKIDTLAAASSQNQLIGWTSTSGANRGKVGAVTIGTGLSLSSGTLNSVWTASGNDVYSNNSGNVGIGTSTPATKFHTVGTVRHQTLGTAITDTTTYKPLVINSSGDVLPSTYWYGGGGGSPAGSNKELQFNNSGSFGGTTGIKYGNATNERLSIWQQSSSDVPLTIRTAGDNSKAAIEIKDTTNQPYTSAIKFSPSPVGSPKASMIYQGYEGLYLDGGCAPYTTADGATVVIGNSTGGVAPFKVHSYPYDVPASPNNWVAKIRTSKTSAVGLAIDWGAAGQTGDLLQFRDNSAAVLASVTSAGNIKAPAPTYSSGGYKFLVRNSTSSQFESIDPLVGSSTYTPTTSGLTNVDSTHVFECQYSWITDATTGLKTVTVSGQVEVYINSANTDSRVILSLPVASSFANEYEAGGSGGVTSASNGLSNHRYSIGVKANTISEAAEFVFNPTSGSCNAKINFSFHYKVNTP